MFVLKRQQESGVMQNKLITSNEIFKKFKIIINQMPAYNFPGYWRLHINHVFEWIQKWFLVGSLYLLLMYSQNTHWPWKFHGRSSNLQVGFMLVIKLQIVSICPFIINRNDQIRNLSNSIRDQTFFFIWRHNFYVFIYYQYFCTNKYQFQVFCFKKCKSFKVENSWYIKIDRPFYCTSLIP